MNVWLSSGLVWRYCSVGQIHIRESQLMIGMDEICCRPAAHSDSVKAINGDQSTVNNAWFHQVICLLTADGRTPNHSCGLSDARLCK